MKLEIKLYKNLTKQFIGYSNDVLTSVYTLSSSDADNSYINKDDRLYLTMEVDPNSPQLDVFFTKNRVFKLTLEEVG